MKTILVVDDEEMLLLIFGRLLQRMKHRVLLAANGEEALELYKDNNPDIVFLDFMLKDTNGSKLLAQMKEINKKPYIYFVTGCDEELIQKLSGSREHAPEGILQKPISAEAVREILK